MAKLPKAYKQNIIWSKMDKNKLSIVDVCRELDCTYMTLTNYINDPGLIRMRDITILAGLFGMFPEELVYCLRRSRPQLKPEDTWYLESVINKDIDK